MTSDLVRLGLDYADTLDERTLRFEAGIVRQLANRVVELEHRVAGPRDRDTCTGLGCQSCGGPIDQPRRGRPRDYCSTCRPPKKSKNASIDLTTTGE